MNNNIIDINCYEPEELNSIINDVIQDGLEEYERFSFEEKTAEPIKDLKYVDAMCDYFISNGKYRDNMLFVCGINWALRVGDLLTVRFGDIIENGKFKNSFRLVEQKTAHTRVAHQNRKIVINQAVKDAVNLYLANVNGTVNLNDYMFTAEGGNMKLRSYEVDGKTYYAKEHITAKQVNRILQSASEACGVPYKISSHSMRKTFGYHQMAMSNNDPRKLLLLQQMFNHSSSVITLRYIGLTDEEIVNSVSMMNLGSDSDYRRNTNDNVVGIQMIG